MPLSHGGITGPFGGCALICACAADPINTETPTIARSTAVLIARIVARLRGRAWPGGAAAFLLRAPRSEVQGNGSHRSDRDLENDQPGAARRARLRRGGDVFRARHALSQSEPRRVDARVHQRRNGPWYVV